VSKSVVPAPPPMLKSRFSGIFLLRILQVIHQFPPYSSQGSEVYCYNLSRQLSATEDVRVFHLANGKRRWFRRLHRETYGGLPIYHSVDGAEYSRLAAWPNSFLRDQFQSVLEEFAPQIVHFHNFLSLADDLVSMARASGAGVVYTLHDFGLICPNGLLLRSDGKLCSKEDGDFFQDCCPALIRTSGQDRRAAPLAARLPSLARWRLYGQQYPSPALRRLLLAAIGGAERWLGKTNRVDGALKRDFFWTHTRRIFHDADLFLAPSQFLLRRYVSCGIPENKIVHVKNGMRRHPPIPRKKTAGQIRFGYIGAIHVHKGVELLLEAFRGLEDRATLSICGSAFGSPVSKSYWQRIRERQPPSVIFRGTYENEDIGGILEGLDVIVVPSLWYENAPLTIQEAFMFGVPVITADKGGMAELVRDGINGLQFRLGNAADLREKMRYIIDHPEVLDQLRRGIPEVTNIEQHAAELRVHYDELLQARRPEFQLSGQC
jgi:glycosyltransferase involved in cell wall biosynthesis